MFRIVCDPSSGSVKLYLTEIRSGSLMFVVCLIGVWQRNYAAKHRLSTRQTSVNHYEQFQSSTALHSLMMDRIRSETCGSDL